MSELNKLLKMNRQMADMMKKMGKGGMMKKAMAAMMGKGGGMPDPSQMDPAALEAASKQLGAMKGMPGMPAGMGGLPGGLSGFGKKK